MQLLTFSLGEVKYGIPIEDVQSIEQREETVGIPNTLPYIQGIINLHGRIIPIYSLAKLFGYPEQKMENIVVTDVGGMQVGFEVCKVEEILNVEDKDVTPMPDVIRNGPQYISDVANHNKNLIVLLDVEQVISKEERESLKEMIDQTNAELK